MIDWEFIEFACIASAFVIASSIISYGLVRFINDR